MTLTSKGTASSPCRIICVNHSGSVPPVSADLRTTATVSTTVGSNINFAGHAYSYGVTYTAGSGNNISILNWNSSSSWSWVLQSCSLAVGSTSSSSLVSVGATSGNPEKLTLINTPVSFGDAGQSINLNNAEFEWRGTASAVAGTAPTTLFSTTSRFSVPTIVGVDLSALGSGKNLVSVAGTSAKFLFQDCKLGSSVSVTTGSMLGPGGTEVRLVNCDSADTNYRYYRQTYQGTTTQETTIVRTGGASDGTTPVSRKMVSTANSKLYSPLESDWMVAWNETTGSSLTATIEIVNDGTTLTDADVWVEVEYLGTSSFPLGNFASDRAADVLATGANQTTSSVTWTTTGLASPTKQKLVATFTPVKKGPVRVRVCLAKASQTLYFDPLPTIA